MPQTPVTSAPSALAICTANVPTPPEAAFTSTLVPSPTSPTSRMAIRAVTPDMTDAAASSNESPAGFGISWDAGTTVSSAYVPTVRSAPVHDDPKTSSPGWRSVTLRPTSSTTPATSVPRIRERGPRRPDWTRSTYGMPATVIQSGVFTQVARTRTSTPSSPTAGGSTSARPSTCSGAP